MNTLSHLVNIKQACQSSNDLYFFILQSDGITSKYTSLLNERMSSSFSSSQYSKEKIRKQKEQFECFYQFLLCCRKYVTNWKEYIYDGDMIRKTSLYACHSCGNVLLSSNQHVCNVCGTNQEEHQKVETNNTSGCRMNMMNKYTYERLTNFKELISKIQGKQQSKIPSHIYTDVIEMIERHHTAIEESNINKIRYKNVTTNDVLNYLKELKLKKYYKDSALIHFNITGTKPFSINAAVEKAIMKDYVDMLNLYNRYQKQGRRSFLNSQYLFCKLLIKHNIKVNINEFAHLKTRERLIWHDEMYDKMSKELGWNDTRAAIKKN